jgi:hypothetical protein
VADPCAAAVSVEFEGIYMNATVYISGHDLGTHPYGYTSFSHDLTAHLRPGGNNVLANRPGHPLSGGHLMSIRRAVERLLAPVRKRRMDRELESEIAAYLELAELDALHRGPSPKRHAAARLSFGGIEVVKEHRDRRSFRWMETLARDFRFGFSSLIREPG